MGDFHVETIGSGPRVVLVHGSVGNGSATWEEVRPLADRFELAIVDRPGYPPNAPLARIDFEQQADEIGSIVGPRDHLVGHSYGGVISLLIAAGRPVRSLAVNEPPAFGLARDDPAVEELLAQLDNPPTEPRAYLAHFLPLVGSTLRLPDPLPPPLEAGARAAMAERTPAEAKIPLDELAAAPFPKLVVSGGHSAAFDAVADVLDARLGAEHAVVPGAGHSIPRAAGYPKILARFLDAA